MVFEHGLLICLTCVAIIHAEYNTICDLDGTKCEEVPMGLEGKPLDQFRSWWNKMSEPRPLTTKCDPPSEFPYTPGVKPPIVESFKCSQKDFQIHFEFSGLIDPNHLFQGPGKLTIFENRTMEQVHKHPGTCIRYRQASFIIPKIVTGAFLNGKPHGLVRIESEDKGLLIGELKEGCPHGFLRLWTNPSTLKYVYYSFNGDLPITSWYNINGTLAYRNLRQAPEFIENEEDARLVAVAIHNGTNVFVGDDLMDFQIMINSSFARIDTWTEENCLLRPHFTKIKTSIPFTFNPEQGQLVFEEGSNSVRKFCHNCQEDQAKRIQEFLDKFNGLTGRLWAMAPDQAEVDYEAPLVISDLKHEIGLNFTCKLFGSQNPVRARLTFGKIDRHNRILGPFRLSFDSEEIISLPPFDQGIARISGQLINGQLSSFIKIHLKDGGYFDARLKNGMLHGPAVGFLLTTILPLAKEYGLQGPLNSQSYDIRAILNFKNGKVHGPVWIKMIGGGFLYGHLDTSGKFTGDKLAYIYPDYETALVGRFEDKVMKAGQEAFIINTSNDPNGMLTLEFSEPSGPVLFYSPGTNSSFGDGPRTPDPFEVKWTEIKTSNVDGGGEGIFALRDIPSGQIACLYTGYMYRNLEEKELYSARYTKNESLSEDMRRHGTKYSIRIHLTNALIQIPWEVDQPDSWHPTMGHKVNSDFPERNQNAGFQMFEHPRYGLIIAVKAIKDIKKGQEIFVDYGYQKAPFPADFLWYHEAKEKYLQELELKRKDEKFARCEADKPFSTVL